MDNDRYLKVLKEHYSSLQEIDPISAGALAVFGVIAGARGFYKSEWAKAEREVKKRCKKFKGNEKERCIYKTKIEILRKLLSGMTKYRRTCKQTKDPEKCINKLSEIEQKAKEKIKKYEEKLRKL